MRCPCAVSCKTRLNAATSSACSRRGPSVVGLLIAQWALRHGHPAGMKAWALPCSPQFLSSASASSRSQASSSEASWLDPCCGNPLTLAITTMRG
jgi:hypothetical protein